MLLLSGFGTSWAKQSYPTKKTVAVFPFTRKCSHADAIWVSIAAQRKTIEELYNRGFEPVSPIIKSPKQDAELTISGEVVKGESGLSLDFTLLDKLKNTLARDTLSGTIDFFRSMRSYLGVGILYALKVNEDHDTIHQKRPTNSCKAFLYYCKAQSSIRVKKNTKAKEQLLKAVAEDRGFAMALWTVAKLYELEKHKDSASYYYKKAKAIDPSHPQWPLPDEGKSNIITDLLSQSKKSAFKALCKGIEFKSIQTGPSDYCLYLWIVDPRHNTIDVQLQKSTGGNYISHFFSHTQSVLAINGGFFEMDTLLALSPSGLVIQNQSRINPKTDFGGSGVFCMIQGMPKIIWAKEYNANIKAETALQCGPVLVEPGGKMGIYSNDFNRQSRAAIGVKDSTIIIACVAGSQGQGLSLYELAQFLRTPQKEGGAGCEAALNLDGGSSVQTSFSCAGVVLNSSGLWPINNALVITKK